jgi:diguanylate cyclase (GGDEF)-like protein
MLRKSIQSSFLYWGCRSVENPTEKRKIFYTNAGALIAFLSILLFSIIYTIPGNDGLTRGVIAISPSYIFLAAVPWVNRYGHPVLASWLLSLTVTAVILSVVLFSTGTYLGVHLYFIMFAVTVPAYFLFARWRSIVFIFVLNFSLFAWLDIFGFEPQPEVLKLSSAAVTAFQLAYIVSALVTILFIVWLGEYVTEMNETELDQLSGTDALTQLPNRRALSRKLAWTMAMSQRSETCSALLLIDLDNFKTLNDTHGHDAGDAILIETAHRLLETVREIDFVARQGGDEFIVVLNQLDSDRQSSLDAALVVATKIHAALDKPFRFSINHHGQTDVKVEHHCGSCIGVTVFDGHERTQEEIIKLADVAMYKAKTSGRNSVRVQT